MCRRRVASFLVSVAVTAALLVAPAAAVPAAVGPGDLAVDDPFTSARTQTWRDQRYGMFIHFGAYSQFAGSYTKQDGSTCRAAEWIQRNCNVPWPEYEAEAAKFNPSMFSAEAIVNTAKAAGQKYIIITAKHHDGFALWPTEVNDWNLYDRTAFKRDLLGELAAETRRQGLQFGVYYSIWDWHDPDFRSTATFSRYVEKMKAQLAEIQQRYQPSVYWFDGEWTVSGGPVPNPWTATDGADLERYVRGLAPDAVINNRVGKRATGDGDFGTPEQEIPERPVDGQLWESCMTLTRTWGYAEWDETVKTPRTVVENLTRITAGGGNYLLNVGPDPLGRIPTAQANSLRTAGEWLADHGEMIYGAGHTGLVDHPAWGNVTAKGSTLYATVREWPASTTPLLLTTQPGVEITGGTVIGGGAVTVRKVTGGYQLLLPQNAPQSLLPVLKLTSQTPSPTPGNGTGLTARYYQSLSQPPVVTRTEHSLSHEWRYGVEPAPGVGAGAFAARWTGTLTAPATQLYRFVTVASGAVTVKIGGVTVVNRTTTGGRTVDATPVGLVAGGRYAIEVQYSKPAGADAMLNLFWSSPSMPQRVLAAPHMGPSAGADATLVDDADPAFAYSDGTWRVSSGRGYGDLRDAVHHTQDSGATATATVTGKGFAVIGELNPDQGPVEIQVDGVVVATVDTGATKARRTQAVWYRGTFGTPGQHRVTLVKRGGQFLTVDGITVFS
ncbi:alpha-L-fucosidase [Kribbella sp. CA-294648]|uniref:alpha-L-fucosidase n=1 Tax=Kribbella sp. CA-294648 TaxID=3239948 RepID=UPI003D927AA7